MQREGNFFAVREGIRGKVGGMHVAVEQRWMNDAHFAL